MEHGLWQAFESMHFLNSHVTYTQTFIDKQDGSSLLRTTGGTTYCRAAQCMYAPQGASAIWLCLVRTSCNVAPHKSQQGSLPSQRGMCFRAAASMTWTGVACCARCAESSACLLQLHIAAMNNDMPALDKLLRKGAVVDQVPWHAARSVPCCSGCCIWQQGISCPLGCLGCSSRALRWTPALRPVPSLLPCLLCLIAVCHLPRAAAFRTPRLCLQRDYYGCTPLQMAASFGRLEPASMLLERGAQVNMADRWAVEAGCGSELRSATAAPQVQASILYLSIPP